MIQKLTKNWRLLALCGVLQVMISVIYLILYDNGPDGPLTSHGWNSAILFLNWLTLAAGFCAVAAGILGPSKGQSWLLVLNGLVLGAIGLIPLFWRGPLGVRVFEVLVVVAALAGGILALAIARTLRRHAADEWLFGLAGAGSVLFALAFLALVSRWIQLEGRAFHPSVFLWFCCYFGFSAACVLLLGLRLHSLGEGRLSAQP